MQGLFFRRAGIVPGNDTGLGMEGGEAFEAIPPRIVQILPCPGAVGHENLGRSHVQQPTAWQQEDLHQKQRGAKPHTEPSLPKPAHKVKEEKQDAKVNFTSTESGGGLEFGGGLRTHA